MAGAELSRAPSLDRRQRDAVRGAIDEAFVSAFNRVMLGVALLAFAAAAVGSAHSLIGMAVRFAVREPASDPAPAHRQ